MIGYRRLAAGALVAGLAAGWCVARAEEPAPKPAAPATPAKPDAAKPEAAKPAAKKEPFFGDRFAMYLDVQGGPAKIDSLVNPITTTSNASTASEITLDGNKTGRFTIGWTLPRGRGQYLFRFTGVADGKYKVDATGYQRSYIQTGGGSSQTPVDELPWWQLNIDNGTLHATKTPPVWDSGTDDANNNGFPDRNEIRFPATTVDLTSSVPDDLGNNLQTYDLYYRREFGGVRYRGAWYAGGRYLNYDGAMPCPAWVVGTIAVSGFGFTDGIANKLILMKQSTSGWGPVGGGEADFNFFRQRLTIYGVVEAAFLLEKLDGKSEPFTFLAFNQQGGTVFIPGEGFISKSISKSAWNTSIEIGARVKVAEGFHLFVNVTARGYLDTVVFPDSLSIPANATQFSLGTLATFVTRDIVTNSANLGLSFQF